MNKLLNKFSGQGAYDKPSLMDRFMNPMTQAGLALLTGGNPSTAATNAVGWEHNREAANLAAATEARAAEKQDQERRAQLLKESNFNAYVSTLSPSGQREANAFPDATSKNMENTAAEKNYGKAVNGGYTGTFAEYQKEMRSSGNDINISTNVGSTTPGNKLWDDYSRLLDEHGKDDPRVIYAWNLVMNSNSELNNQKLTQIGGLIDDLDDVLDKIYVDPKTGEEYPFDTPMDIIMQSAKSLIGVFTQKNPNYRLYEHLSEGLLSVFARSIGQEKGTLNDRDVARAKKLMPIISGVMDTPEVARAKLAFIREYIDRVKKGNIEGPDSGNSDENIDKALSKLETEQTEYLKGVGESKASDGQISVIDGVEYIEIGGVLYELAK